MSLLYLLYFLMTISFLGSSVNSYKILIYVPGLSNSQLMLNYRLGQLLSSNGHQVTLYVAQYTSSINIENKKPKNVTIIHYDVGNGFDQVKDQMDSMIFQDTNPIWSIPHFIRTFSIFKEVCENQIKNKELMEKLKKQKFDIAIGHMYDLCPLGMFKALEIPTYIWMSSGVFLDYMAWLVGVPSPPSFVPNVMSSFSDRMSLGQRIGNLMGVSISHLIQMNIILGPYTKLFKQHFGPEFPDVFELAAKSPLVFVNSEELIDFPRPILHKVIYVGGFDSAKPEPLQGKWKEIMDNANQGVVLFSLGSVANASKMPESWKMAFLDAFSRFPEYTFIWKFEAPMPEAANVKNVILTKWAPQKDLLGHPNMKAFISHGGFNSYLETVSNGVPFIALPLFGDQLGNFKRAERHGVALGLKKTEVTAENIYDRLKNILTNSSYSANAKTLASMLKKKPVKADQLILGWVEFLAEHKELPNLQPVSAEMSLIEYFLIDVAAILCIIAAVLLLFIWGIFQCVRYFCCRKSGSIDFKTKAE